jgi:hypothetical protein
MAALHVRTKDLLPWETGGRAQRWSSAHRRDVVRLVPDALSARLPIPEVSPSSCHEAGHARLRHLLRFLLVGLPRSSSSAPAEFC